MTSIALTEYGAIKPSVHGQKAFPFDKQKISNNL